ncbi:MAG: hypothetical protein M0014_14100 [Actinomycetota bacterium]|jgi:hypothetical protein|nr:hypothetical protein [Actinomycetota bacterium]
MKLPIRHTPSSKVKLGLAAGLASGALAGVLAIVQRRRHKRAERNNAAFARASEGLWPRDPGPAGESVKIAATRPGGAGTAVPDPDAPNAA